MRLKVQLAFLLSPAILLAQTAGAKIGDDFKTITKTFLNDEWHIWSSPFHAGNYDTHAVVTYMVPFAAITGGLMASDTTIADSLPNTPDQIKWSGHVSSLGGTASLVGFTAGTYLAGRFMHQDHFAETGLLALEALGHTGILTFGFKQATNRERPDAPNVQGIGFWKGGNSFPSGHAAASFTVATIYAYEYRNHIAVPIAAYSIATLISLSRVGARRHWSSDVFVGGTVGFLLGRFTYKRNHRDPLAPQPVHARLTPDFGVGPNGPALFWTF